VGDHKVKVEAKLDQLVETGRETCSFVLCVLCHTEVLRDYSVIETHLELCHDGMGVKDYFLQHVRQASRKDPSAP
jgi:hypothetical protein